MRSNMQSLSQLNDMASLDVNAQSDIGNYMTILARNLMSNDDTLGKPTDEAVTFQRKKLSMVSPQLSSVTKMRDLRNT